MATLEPRSLCILAPPFLVAILFLAACTGGEKQPSPLADRPPYWCELLPKNAVMKVSNATRAEEVVGRSGLLDDQRYSCSVEHPGPRGNLISINVYMKAEANRAVPFARSATGEAAVAVPQELGEGEVVEGFGWALWRCDEEPVYMDVNLYYSYLHPEGTPDRDVKRDLVTLLEIAQRRYAELAACDVKPPDVASSSPAGTPPGE